MASVQFHSANDVLTAFDNIECKAWALLRDGGKLMYKGIGRDELSTFLDLLTENGASNAVYSLAYFEGVTDRKSINSKTPFDGSFNFKLNDDGQEINGGQYKNLIKQQSLLSKVNGLESKFDKLIELMSNEHEPEPENKLGIVGALLEHPAIAPLLPGLIEKIAGGLFGSATRPPQTETRQLYPVPAARVSGFEQSPAMTAFDSAAIETAIDKLYKFDSKLADHLEKLVWLAENNKPTFDFLMSQLDQMKPDAN